MEEPGAVSTPKRERTLLPCAIIAVVSVLLAMVVFSASSRHDYLGVFAAAMILMVGFFSVVACWGWVREEPPMAGDGAAPGSDTPVEKRPHSNMRTLFIASIIFALPIAMAVFSIYAMVTSWLHL
jgi:hypothetical protein